MPRGECIENNFRKEKIAEQTIFIEIKVILENFLSMKIE